MGGPGRKKILLLNYTIEDCRSILGQNRCASIIPEARILTSLHNIKRMHDDLLMYVKIPANGTHDEHNSTHEIKILRKRALFGFVGWLHKILYGTMDENDRERIGEQMAQLFNRQKNMSILEAEQTHILKSNLEKIYSYLEDEQSTMASIQESSQNLINKTKERNDKMEYVQVLIKWVNDFENTLKASTEIYHTLMSVVEASSLGHLHPLLLTHEQLHMILDSITEANKGEDLPVQTDITPEYLLSVSKTSVFSYKGMIITTLQIPLVYTEQYQYYRMHSIPVAKPFINNTKKYIRIKPDKEYIIVSNNSNSFALSDREFMDTCTRARNGLLCEPNIEIVDSSLNNPCEFDIMNGPSRESFKKCSFEMVNSNKTFWKKLHAPNKWIYSALIPENIKILCKNETSTLNISGTGILLLNRGCRARTTVSLLYGIETIYSLNFTSPIYEPTMTLTVAELLPTIFNGLDVDNPSTKHLKLIDWTNTKDIVKLKDIESQFRMISDQDQITTTNYMNLALASFANTILIILAVIALIKCTPICAHLQKFCCKINKKQPRGYQDKEQHELDQYIFTPRKQERGSLDYLPTQGVVCT